MINRKLSKDSLIHQKGCIEIYFENENTSNQTNSEIVIAGNELGFLNLASLLIYHLNNLDDVICVSEFPFTKSRLIFEIAIDDEIEDREGKIFFENNKITWSISEDNLSIIATDIHSLAFINDELHLDHLKKMNEISLYFVTDDELTCDS